MEEGSGEGCVETKKGTRGGSTTEERALEVLRKRL